MAIILILPAFMFLTLGAIALFGLDKPPVEQTTSDISSAKKIEEFQLAA
jgi:hypothetical protein